MKLSITSVLGLSMLICLFPGCGGHDEAAPAPPMPVQVAQVLQRDVPITVEGVGQTRGSEEVEVRARVEGYIMSVDFREGTAVDKGQPLFSIDPTELQATLAQAKAGLAEAEAELARAKQDVARYRPLAEQNAIPRQDLETAEALEHSAAAVVDARRAEVESAQIDLGYTKVVAPVAGLVGKAEVRVGNLVGRGESTLLTSLSDIDPIHVRVGFAERDYLTLVRKRQEQGKAETLPESEKIEMILADGSVHPHPGKVVFVDRAVDAATGTLLVEAAFSNPDGIVRPGQFAKIRAVVDFQKGALLVPQKAVQEIQATYQVAVVAPGDTIQVRSVTPGARVGSLWVIEKGLEPGERIVVEGLQKVRRGMKVQPTMVEIQESAPPSPKAGASGS